MNGKKNKKTNKQSKNKKRGRKSLLPNKEMFETMYYNNNIKASDLANNYGVKTQTIYNWANKFRKQQDM